MASVQRSQDRNRRFLFSGFSCYLVVSCVLQSIQPFLFQQNSASLCKGSLQRRVFCLVAIETEEGIAGGQPSQAPKTLDLARIKSLLNISRQKYLEGQFAGA